MVVPVEPPSEQRLVVLDAFRAFAIGAVVLYHYLCGISYALYLPHQNLGVMLIRSLVRRGIPDWLSPLLAVLVCSLLAVALTYLIERPVRRFLSTWAHGRILTKVKYGSLGQVVPSDTGPESR
jgi:peptidoglycan/LPS O-acetylase OafA/YrhL